MDGERKKISQTRRLGFENGSLCARVLGGLERRANVSRSPDRKRLYGGARLMPDSIFGRGILPSKSLANGNWRSLGSVIADLKAEIDRAIAARDAIASAELLDAEREQAIRATVRRFNR